MDRQTLIGMLALMACGNSHAPSADAALDTVPDVNVRDVLCPPTPSCVRGTCCDQDRRPAEVSGLGCTAVCPDGWVQESLCDPGPTCARFDACADNTDCTLATNTCCVPCGVPSLSDFDAINATQLDGHRMSVCPEPEPGGCPRCATGPNPNLGASCETGTCQGFDLSLLALTQCVDATDCRIRSPDCCECGGAVEPFSLIAIRTDAGGAYESLVCNADTACLECLPVYPEGVVAACTEGRCTIAFLD